MQLPTSLETGRGEVGRGKGESWKLAHLVRSVTNVFGGITILNTTIH